MASSRRSFLSDMLKACIGASILPAALTYNRKWKYDKTLFIPNPAFETAEYGIYYILNPEWSAKHNEITTGRFIGALPQEKAVLYKKNEQGFFTRIATQI